jgi:hypothetical protein
VSYLEASALLAQDLGRLLCMRPQPPSYAGLQAALSGRAATLDLLVSVHREVAGQSPDAVQLTMADLGRHPVAVLGRALRDHPRIHADLSPTGVHALEQSTEAGRTWLSASRHALVAHHDWLGDWAPMTGDAAWSVLADVAALSRAIAVLDEGLVRDASRLHRLDVASGITPGRARQPAARRQRDARPSAARAGYRTPGEFPAQGDPREPPRRSCSWAASASRAATTRHDGAAGARSASGHCQRTHLSRCSAPGDVRCRPTWACGCYAQTTPRCSVQPLPAHVAPPALRQAIRGLFSRPARLSDFCAKPSVLLCLTLP